MLILSGDISLNPGSVYNSHSSGSVEWNVFKAKLIHLIHLNVNSLLPKIDEIRYITARTNATVIGISQCKFDETILQSEIQIPNYELFRCDGNRNGGGVAYYIRRDTGYLQKHFFPKEMENIFVEILFSETKPLIDRIIYRPPDQSNFLEFINANFDKLDTNIKESYILDTFNIDMYHNNKYIVRDDKTISLKFLSSDIKNYHQFCTMHDSKQLIKSSTRV